MGIRHPSEDGTTKAILEDKDLKQFMDAKLFRKRMSRDVQPVVRVKLQQKDGHPYVYVYKTPSQHERLGSIPCGEMAELLAESGDAWMQVRWNNIIGWVGRRNVAEATIPID